MLKLNNVDVVRSIFPNGETDFAVDREELISNTADELVDTYRFDDRPYCNELELVYEDDRDLFRLLMVGMLLKEIGLSRYTLLSMRFVPYSQMDREMPDHMFSLKYFAMLVNNCEFGKVEILDPHSEVTTALFNNVTVWPNHHFAQALYEKRPDVVMYPDTGAMKKYSKQLKDALRSLGITHALTDYFPGEVFGVKRRDLSTGDIVSYDIHVPDDVQISGKSVLIVDDLVMGGRTFKEAATRLRKLGAAKIYLCVTHLMPQAKDFYRTKADGLIDKIITADTLDIVYNFNLDAPVPVAEVKQEEPEKVGDIVLAKGDMMELWKPSVVKQLQVNDENTATVVFVDTVNLNGFGGAGIAGMFRKYHPEVYARYKKWCENVNAETKFEGYPAYTVGLLVDKPEDRPGLWHADRTYTNRAVLLVNTMPSSRFLLDTSEEAVEEALRDIKRLYEDAGFEALPPGERILVLPALGCGIGGVRWAWALPKMLEAAKTYVDNGMFEKVVIMEPGYKSGTFEILEPDLK